MSSAICFNLDQSKILSSGCGLVSSMVVDCVALYLHIITSLPNEKNFLLTKLKAFADNKMDVAKMMISVFDRIENIVGKGENARYQHFLLFSQYFQKASSPGLLKVGIVWERVTLQFVAVAQNCFFLQASSLYRSY